MYVFNRQRNLFPHVLQVCKSFLRCIDVIEIFKFRPIFMGPASQWHWKADSTLEMWTHGTQHPSPTRLQTFDETRYWIRHTHPRTDTDLVDWTFTISITGCKFDRRLQDDSRCITSDVFSSPPTSSRSTNIATYDRYSPQRPTRLFKQPRVVSDRGWQRCPGAAGDNIWVDQHYHRRPIF